MWDEEVKTLIQDVKEADGYLQGWVKDYQKFEDDLRILTGVSFVTRNSCRSSKDANIYFKYFNKYVPIPLLDCPFKLDGGNIRKACARGHQYQDHRVKKLRMQKTCHSTGDNCAVKKRRSQISKKTDCPCLLHVRGITVYPDYMPDIAENAMPYQVKLARKKLKEKLLADLADSGVEVRCERRWYVHVPLVSSHNHPIDTLTKYSQNIHPRIAEKIVELVSQGITDKHVIRSRLDEFVTKKLCTGRNIFYELAEVWVFHVTSRLHRYYTTIYRVGAIKPAKF